MTTGEILAPAATEPVLSGLSQTARPQEGLPNFLRSRAAIVTGLLAAWAIREGVIATPLAMAQTGQTCTTVTYPDGSYSLECVAGGADTGSQSEAPTEQSSAPSETDNSSPQAEPEASKPKEDKDTGKEKTPKKPTPRLSERQQAAKEVIRLVHDGRIVIQPLRGGKHEKDLKSHSTPMDNLKSALEGNPSKASGRCGNAPEKAYINPKILKFLSETAQETKIRVTAIVGGCHTDSSEHYDGDAVDMGCKDGKMPAKQEKIMHRVAKRLGLKRFMGENCAQDGHEHWSENGR